MLVAIVAVAWRWKWVGGLALVALAIAYAIIVEKRADWMLVISGPLVVIGALYLWSWRYHAVVHGSR